MEPVGHAVVITRISNRHTKSEIVDYVRKFYECGNSRGSDEDFNVYYPVPCNLLNPDYAEMPIEDCVEAVVEFKKHKDVILFRTLCEDSAEIPYEMFSVFEQTIELRHVRRMWQSIHPDDIAPFLKEQSGVRIEKYGDGELKLTGTKWQLDIAYYYIKLLMRSKLATDIEFNVPELTQTLAKLKSQSNRFMPAGFLINNNIKVIVHKCDITKLKVDAVVNAAKVVVTSGGKMPGPKVIHGFPQCLQENCRLLLERTIENIMQRAIDDNFKSLAMPAISTGIFYVPHGVVADVISHVIISNGQHRCLKEIHLVDVDPLDDMLSLLSKQFYARISSNVTELDGSTVTELYRGDVESIIRERTSPPIGVTTDRQTKPYVYPYDFNTDTPTDDDQTIKYRTTYKGTAKQCTIQVDSLCWKYIERYASHFRKMVESKLRKCDAQMTNRGDQIIISGPNEGNLMAVKAFISDIYGDFEGGLERITLSDEDERQVLERYCSEVVYAHTGSGPVDAVGPVERITRYRREMAKMESTFPGRNTSSDNRSVAPVMTIPGRFPAGFHINNRTKIIVHKCDIMKLIVDAVVSEYVGRQYNRVTEVGVIKCVDDMPCLKIIHASCPQWSKSSKQLQEKCKDELQATIENIMKTANKEKFKSLAMPAISSGSNGVPKHIVAEVIQKVIMSYEPHQCLEEIHLVDQTDEMLSILSKQFYDKRGSAQLDQSTVESIIRRRACLLPIGFMIDNQMELYIYQNDITKLQIEAIACPTDHLLTRSWGLPGVIARTAGSVFKEQCRKRGKESKLNVSDVVSMKPPNLPRIFYVVTSNNPNREFESNPYNDDNLKIKFTNILDSAKRNGIQALALPPFGAGAPAKKVGEILCSSLLDGLGRDRIIPEIHIVDVKTGALYALVREIINRGVRAELIDDGVVQAQTAMSTNRIDPQTGVVYSSDYRNTRPAHRSPDKDITKIRDNNTNHATDPCAICLSQPTNPKVLPKCKHVFCTNCIDDSFKKYDPTCPICGENYGQLTGDQPADGTMTVTRQPKCLHGYTNHDRIVITYDFPSGVQGPEHPRPRTCYSGTRRTAYLPDNEEGNHVLRLLKRAFEARLIFTIRQESVRQGYMLTWNDDIQHKTQKHGGPENSGYPDDTYLTRVQQELAAKGIK